MDNSAPELRTFASVVLDEVWVAWMETAQPWPCMAMCGHVVCKKKERDQNFKQIQTAKLCIAGFECISIHYNSFHFILRFAYLMYNLS